MRVMLFRLKLFMKLKILQVFFLLILIPGIAFSIPVVTGGAMSLGQVSNQIASSFGNLTQFITAGSYIAGVGFFVGAIMSFNQHKDNPTQVTIGKPISLLAIAAALLFLPTVLGVSGQTLFKGSAKTAGPKGVIIR